MATLEGSKRVTLQQIVEQTVTGLGYDLVEIDRSAGGLLRITIDLPWSPSATGVSGQQFVTVEDCEKVTRQLQFALEVEAVEYKRLEVSSPGIDRLDLQGKLQLSGHLLAVLHRHKLLTRHEIGRAHV